MFKKDLIKNLVKMFAASNCPGCLAIAQGIIKRDIENA